MQASLRIWILCIIIAVAVYYLYIKHTVEGFARIETIQVKAASPNNINSNVSSTRETACSEMRSLRIAFMEKIEELRNVMNDLSGTQVLAYNLKSENMKYQYE